MRVQVFWACTSRWCCYVVMMCIVFRMRLLAVRCSSSSLWSLHACSCCCSVASVGVSWCMWCSMCFVLQMALVMLFVVGSACACVSSMVCGVSRCWLSGIVLPLRGAFLASPW